MSENKSNNKRLLGFLVSPVLLIRLSSILVVLLMAGHISAYPWTSTHGLQEIQLVDSMKSLQFEFFGKRSSYWSLYFGWGLLISVLLLTLAIILWLLSDLARLAPRRLGVITGIISASCLVGAYLSFRFFYIPPFLFFSAICVILLTAAVQLLRQQTMFTDGRKQAPSGEGWKAIIRHYLAPDHCDHAGAGCPISALAPDIARTPPGVKKRIANVLKEYREEMLPWMPGGNADERGRNFIVIFSMMIGAVSFARMMPDPGMRRRVLDSIRDYLSSNL